MTSQELLPMYLTVLHIHRRNCNACLLGVLLQLDFM